MSQVGGSGMPEGETGTSPNTKSSPAAWMLAVDMPKLKSRPLIAPVKVPSASSLSLK